MGKSEPIGNQENDILVDFMPFCICEFLIMVLIRPMVIIFYAFNHTSFSVVFCKYQHLAFFKTRKINAARFCTKVLYYVKNVVFSPQIVTLRTR